MTFNTTIIFIIAAIAVIIGYDVWMLAARGYKSTISFTMLTAAQTWPIIPFAIGIVFGHLFWPQ